MTDRSDRLLEAVLVIGSDLSLPAVLRRIAETAMSVIGARYGALGVLDEDGEGLAEFIHVGLDRDQAEAIGHLPMGKGILGLLILEPHPLRLPDLARHPDSYGFPPHHPPMSSFLGVPITVRGQVFGNLYLTEKVGADEFSDEDEATAVSLGAAAAIAIENARLHERSQNVARAQDRERIAADLHDKVIQRLFAAGLALDGILRQVPEEVAGRLEGVVAELDDTIREIRSTIFALTARPDRRRTVRERVLALATEAAGPLGFEPRVRLDGPIDAAVAGPLADDLMAALREMLSNVARHAGATHCEVEVNVSGSEVTVAVSDDGKGPGPTRPDSRGLVNLAARAARWSGTFALAPGPEKGSRARWWVPLTDAAGRAHDGARPSDPS